MANVIERSDARMRNFDEVHHALARNVYEDRRPQIALWMVVRLPWQSTDGHVDPAER